MSTKDIALYGNQYRFVYDPHHYLAFVGGIGSGKSYGGAARALSAALGRIGSQEIPTPNFGVITAPTYPMLRDASLRTFFDIADRWIASYNKSEALITLTNGSEIIARSTEHPDRLRGPSVSWWWGDEAAMYRPDVWRIMIGRLREFGRFGYAWVTTTPKGRNYLWQKFVQQQSDLYKLFTVPTQVNPYLDREWVESLAEDYSGDFARQELGGEFVAFEGLIYPEFDPLLHVTSAKPPAFSRVVAGVDFGYTHASVIQVIGADHDGGTHLIHEDYARKRLDADLAATAKQLRDLYNIDTFYCDPANPDGIKEFKKLGLRAEGANNSVLTGIQAIKARLMRTGRKPRLLLYPGTAWAQSEFEQYQWLENKEGLRDVPRKTNDHAMDALRYGVMGIEGERRGLPTATARRAV